eukprot:scaffold27901_cov171-Skeletonema_menzelii.AAC.1
MEKILYMHSRSGFEGSFQELRIVSTIFLATLAGAALLAADDDQNNCRRRRVRHVLYSKALSKQYHNTEGTELLVTLSPEPCDPEAKH